MALSEHVVISITVHCFWLPSIYFTLSLIHRIRKSHIVPAWSSNSSLWEEPSLYQPPMWLFDLLTYEWERQIINSPPSFSINYVNHDEAGIDIFCWNKWVIDNQLGSTFLTPSYFLQSLALFFSFNHKCHLLSAFIPFEKSPKYLYHIKNILYLFVLL